MNYDLWISISNYVIAGGIILTALGGFGNFKFTKLSSNLKDQKNTTEKIELNSRIDSLLTNQGKLSEQLDPFVEYAKELYPNKNLEEALTQLRSDIKNQNIKIEDLESDLGNAKEEIHKPPKLEFIEHKITTENGQVKVLIILKPNKHVQLGELEFTVTLANMEDDSQILSIATDPEFGDYHIIGPYLNKTSTNLKQAKLKYKLAGYVEFPNIAVVLNKEANLIIEGNHELKAVNIKMK